MRGADVKSGYTIELPARIRYEAAGCARIRRQPPVTPSSGAPWKSCSLGTPLIKGALSRSCHWAEHPKKEETKDMLPLKVKTTTAAVALKQPQRRRSSGRSGRTTTISPGHK